MGLVVFGNNAFTQCPLTLDHNILENFVDYLEIGMAGSGTAIGSALAVALKRVKTIDSDSKVIVLVTDGKSNSGEVRPEEAAELAKNFGVKVYTVGIGGPGAAPFPTRSFFGGSGLRNQMMEFDEETLIQIAKVTGAQYFRADDLESLSQIYKEIDKIEERKEETEINVSYQDQFLPWLKAGLALLLGYVLLSNTIFRRVP